MDQEAIEGAMYQEEVEGTMDQKVVEGAISRRSDGWYHQSKERIQY